MKNPKPVLVWMVVVVIILLSFINVWLIFRSHQTQIRTAHDRIASLEEYIASIPTPIDGQDGKTPVKGVDYKDGSKGEKGDTGAAGKDSVSTHTIERETIIKELPAEIITPDIRCNAEKNRWEVRFTSDPNWQLLNGELVKCTLDTVLE